MRWSISIRRPTLAVDLPLGETPVYRGAPQAGVLDGRVTSVANIRVQYFAILRERAGVAAETVETDAATAEALYRELAARHRFPPLQSIKVAINDEFRDWHSPLADGDSVVFIPPVAGG